MHNIVCKVCAAYRYWVDRLNVAEGSNVVMHHEEAWRLKRFLEESQDEHTKGS